MARAITVCEMLGDGCIERTEFIRETSRDFREVLEQDELNDMKHHQFFLTQDIKYHVMN